MMNTPAYNFAPLLEILILAATLAGFMLLAWLLRARLAHSRKMQLRVLCLMTLFLCFDLVVFGAFTRLTDSGLGCPDWPGCYGQSSPFGAHAAISAAQTAEPTGPVTHSKAWIEMIHRYLAMTVGALILTMTVLAWLRRKELNSAPAWAGLALAWVLVQGAFGAWTVTLKLQPIIVTAHLLGGMLLLVLLRLLLQSLSERNMFQQETPKKLLALGIAALWVQIGLGAWVSSNYAVMACGSYPLCNGEWWPAMDWKQGFTLWRSLGQNSDGSLLSAQALMAIHFVHRWFAWLVLVVLAICAYRYRRLAESTCFLLALLLCLQVATGIINVVFQWPLVAALMHTAGAAWLLLTSVSLYLQLRAEK